MSILNSILENNKLRALSDEIYKFENAIEKCRQKLLMLQEAPMDFADQYDDEWKLLDEVSRRMEVAKKALGLANRLKKPEDRAYHTKRVITILNRLRGLLTKLTRKLTHEIK